MSLLRWMTIAATGALLAATTACGSDDDGDDGAGASGGTGGTGGSAAGAGGTGGAVGGTGGTAGGSGGTAGGAGGSGGATSGAAAFCSEYETTCGFGTDRYADMADCESMYESYAAERQGCVETHVGLAGDDPDLHCPHATGEAPCN